MKAIILSLAFVALSVPVWAAEPAKVSSETLPPLPGSGMVITGDSAPVAETPAVAPVATPEQLTPEQVAAKTAAAGAALCKAVDVMAKDKIEVPGPDYKPGVDAYGKPVVPAEGTEAQRQYTVPERVDIPLDVNILQAVGLTPQAGLDLKANLGTLTVLQGGQTFYNGQDQSATVNSYCTNLAAQANQQKTEAKQP